MRQKEISKLNRFVINNRWKRPKYSRQDSWTIIGITKWWSGVYDYCWKVCIFGVDFCFWFKREFKDQ